MSSQKQSEAKVVLDQPEINNELGNATHILGQWREFNSFKHPSFVKDSPKPIVENKGKRNVNPDFIKYFCGDELFLSNFYLTPIRWEGITYPSVEHALQASLCYEPSDRMFFTIGTAKDARRLGRQVKRHHLWREIIISVIDELLEIKFKDPILKQKLVDTYPKVIHVGHEWGHDYRDLNMSGRLMYLRDCLRTGYNWRHDL